MAAGAMRHGRDEMSFRLVMVAPGLGGRRTPGSRKPRGPSTEICRFAMAARQPKLEERTLAEGQEPDPKTRRDAQQKLSRSRKFRS